MAVATIQTFQAKLERGQIAEGLVAIWLRSQGWTLLPIYEKEIDNGKGPRLFLPYDVPEKELIAPDLLAMRDGKTRWYEAKSKAAATFYRRKWRWQTGIDKKHYLDYKRVKDITSWQVWLLFLQLDNSHNNAPLGVEPYPAGLYACPVTKPYSDEGSFTRDGKRYEMVYWGLEELQRVATLKEVLAA
jgi:hypothetical protein